MYESDGTMCFTGDERMMMVEELSELVIDHMEFCGMDLEFYLPDPHDPLHLCFILCEDHEYIPASMVKHFCSGPISYSDYSKNNMDLAYKAIRSVLDDLIKQSIRPLLPPTLKYGPILWIYVVCEVRTASFQHINHSSDNWRASNFAKQKEKMSNSLQPNSYKFAWTWA